MANGSRVNSFEWVDPTDVRIYKARLHAIADLEDSIYASYEFQHGENCVLRIDKAVRDWEKFRKNLVPGNLAVLSEMGILVGSSVTSCAFGYSGFIRIWDPRTREVVWETNEPGSGRSSIFGDSFADVAVDHDRMSLFKVCSKSDDLG